MSPRVEQIVVASFLPPNIDMDDFSSISSKDLDSLQLNAQVTYYLFSTLSKEMQDVILEEEDIHEDAHLIWKILEEMYAKTPCDDLFIEAEMSSEECLSPPPTFCELQVTLEKNQDSQRGNDPVSLQKPVRTVHHTGQTSCSRDTPLKCNNGTSQESSKASSSNASSCSIREKENQIMKLKKLLTKELDELKQSHDLLANRHEALAKD
jgi:hypothetical protein